MTYIISLITAFLGALIGNFLGGIISKVETKRIRILCMVAITCIALLGIAISFYQKSIPDEFSYCFMTMPAGIIYAAVKKTN